MINSYDIIANAVRKYWKETYPQEVVVFFYQKYDFEKQWEQCEELVYSDSDSDYETVHFQNDFCEGQTNVKDIHVIPLQNVLNYYREKTIKEGD